MDESIYPNPKLAKLKEVLTEQWKTKCDFCCLILVKTRDLAESLERWMNADRDLACFNPGRLTGVGQSTFQGGISFQYYSPENMVQEQMA